MLDYSLTEEDSKTFILNYCKAEDDLIIYYANGDKKKIPYSQEQECEILSTMRSQITCANIKKKVMISENKYHTKSALLWGTSSIANLLIITTQQEPNFLSSFIGGFSVGSTIINLNHLFRNREIEKDIEKTEYFAQHEQYLNNHVRLEGALDGISEETFEIINRIPSERQIFDINTIHMMPLKDIIQIKENIDRILKRSSNSMLTLEP